MRSNIWKRIRIYHVILETKSVADATVNEIERFLALYVLTGIVKKPELSEYWSTNPLLRTPIFGEIMSRNQFQTTLEFLRFNDNSKYNRNNPNWSCLF